MLNIKIKSQQWKDIFLSTELGQHIDVQEKINIASKSLESYELVINERCVHIETPKQTAKCMLEVLGRGGFDELLLDSCGGYAKLVRVDRKGLPTYFIHPPSFKLGPKIVKTRSAISQGIPKTTRTSRRVCRRQASPRTPSSSEDDDEKEFQKKIPSSGSGFCGKRAPAYLKEEVFKDGRAIAATAIKVVRDQDRKIVKKQSSSASSFSRLDDSNEESSEEESEPKLRPKPYKTVSSSSSEDDENEVEPLRNDDRGFETVSQRPQKKGNSGVGGGAAVVGIVGFAFVVGTMAYVLSNSGGVNSGKKKSP